MADLNDLLIRIDATTEQLRRELKVAEGAVAVTADRIDQKLRKADNAFDRLGAASRRMSGILRGSGALAIFTMIERRLEVVAEKFKDTDASARQFVDTMGDLRRVGDTGALAVLHELEPAMRVLGDLADIAAKNVQILVNALAMLPTSGIATLRGLGALLPEQGNQYAGTIVRGGGAEETVMAEMDLTQRENFARIDQRAKDAPRQRAAMMKQYREEDAEFLDGAFETYMVDVEEAAAASKRIAEQDAEFWEGILETHQADWEAAQKVIDDAQEQAMAFGEMFAANLVQASEGGFDEFLQMWERTLAQMVTSALATNLFESLFPKGLAGGIGSGGFGAGLFKAFGFAKGGDFTVGGSGGPDSQFFPMRLSPGERVSIAPPGKSSGMGDVYITNHVDASGSDPARVAQAMQMAEQSAIAKVRDLQRRGR